MVRDVSTDPDFAQSVDEATGFHTRSILCTPMSVQGVCIGAIELINKKDESQLFSEPDLMMLKTLASAAALAIRKLLEARHSWIFERAARSVVVNSIQLMKHLVVSGQFIAVTSELDAGPELRSGQLQFVPISDSDIFRQKFAVISNLQIPESNITQTVIGITVQILKNLTNVEGELANS